MIEAGVFDRLHTHVGRGRIAWQFGQGHRWNEMHFVLQVQFLRQLRERLGQPAAADQHKVTIRHVLRRADQFFQPAALL
ncbi:hypothetical protein D3C80_1631860 [compost metagenome]